MCSLTFRTRAYCVRPHGSLAAGRYFINVTAGAENCAGLTRFATNGAARARTLPTLHAAEVTVVKSPDSICAVGMNAIEVDGAERRVVVCSPAKKNNLFFLTGPPNVPPN